MGYLMNRVIDDSKIFVESGCQYYLGSQDTIYIYIYYSRNMNILFVFSMWNFIICNLSLHNSVISVNWLKLKESIENNFTL